MLCSIKAQIKIAIKINLCKLFVKVIAVINRCNQYRTKWLRQLFKNNRPNYDNIRLLHVNSHAKCGIDLCRKFLCRMVITWRVHAIVTCIAARKCTCVRRSRVCTRPPRACTCVALSSRNKTGPRVYAFSRSVACSRFDLRRKHCRAAAN